MSKIIPDYVKTLREDDVDRVLIPESNRPAASSVVAKVKEELQAQIEKKVEMPAALEGGYLKYTQDKGVHWAMVEGGGNSDTEEGFKKVYFIDDNLEVAVFGWTVSNFNAKLGLTADVILPTGTFIIDNQFTVVKITGTQTNNGIKSYWWDFQNIANSNVIKFMPFVISPDANGKYQFSDVYREEPVGNFLMDKNCVVYKIKARSELDFLNGYTYTLTKYCEAIGGGGSIEVDTEFSETSENPVQNKVIKAGLDKKLDAPPSVMTVNVGDTIPSEGLLINKNFNIEGLLSSLSYSSGISNFIAFTTNVNESAKKILMVLSLKDVYGVNGYVITDKITGDGTLYFISEYVPDEAIEAVLGTTLSKKGWLVDRIVSNDAPIVCMIAEGTESLFVSEAKPGQILTKTANGVVWANPFTVIADTLPTASAISPFMVCVKGVGSYVLVCDASGTFSYKKLITE